MFSISDACIIQNIQCSELDIENQRGVAQNMFHCFEVLEKICFFTYKLCAI